MDKLAELILNRYVNLAKDMLQARHNSFTEGDVEKVAGYLIEEDQDTLEKRGIFGQVWKAKRALRKASKALEVEKLNQKTQRLLDKTHRLEQGKPGTIGSLISGALAVSAAGALGGGLLMHQYDSHAEKKRQKEIATRFYFEGLKRGRS